MWSQEGLWKTHLKASDDMARRSSILSLLSTESIDAEADGIRSSGPCDVDGHRSAALMLRSARFTRFCPRASIVLVVHCRCPSALVGVARAEIGCASNGVTDSPGRPPCRRADRRSSGAERLPCELRLYLWGRGTPAV
jgi:hypothetical protein